MKFRFNENQWQWEREFFEGFARKVEGIRKVRES